MKRYLLQTFSFLPDKYLHVVEGEEIVDGYFYLSMDDKWFHSSNSPTDHHSGWVLPDKEDYIELSEDEAKKMLFVNML